MLQPKLISFAQTAPIQPPRLTHLREIALDHVDHGNPSLAIRVLSKAFFEPNQWFWSDERKRKLLRSVWNSIEEFYENHRFQTAGDKLLEINEAKDLEYKIRGRNRCKYNRRVRTVNRLAGELIGMNIDELDDEFRQATDFGSCRTLIEVMCSGELGITEGKLSVIAEHLL